ncbi:MAG TPA: DinB family protein [Pyrinomonadaceae bacterium]|nr:DinB family protein [Pyrinomonadaceae bacterium]
MLTYHSVAEIYESLDGTRERLRATLAGLSPEAEDFRDSPERWTIAEIVEHLSLVEGQIGRIMSKFIDKVEAEGGAASGAGATRTPLVDLNSHAERMAQGFDAPETARPKGGVPVSESLARLGASSEAIRALRPRVETLDLSSARFPHPAFGPLDIYQWLAVLGLHEERHRRQIETLKDSLAQRAAPQT